MPDINFQSNTFQSGSVNMGYDLQAEKQRIAEGTEAIKKELAENWKKQYAGAQIFPETLGKLNPEAIKALLSFKNTLLYNDIAEKLALNSKQRSLLPKIVWGICLNKAWSQLKIALIEHLGVHESVAEKISTILLQNIINEVREKANIQPAAQNNFFQKQEGQKIEEQNRSVTLSPEEAYRQFPEIGEQLITNEPIKLQSSSSPARPSIKNWLADYTFKLGFNAHSSIERSNYLFQDENAKNLPFQEKQRLSYLLKAYDEKNPLTINVSSKTVVFPNAQENQSNSKSTSNQSDGKSFLTQEKIVEKNNPISFSYAQKLPYEKMQATKLSMPSAQPISFPKKEDSSSPAARNVVNLKELD